MIAWQNLYFGKAAAENEVAENPDRFYETYFDRWSLGSAIENDRRFLVLGPKGAGKSAAAHYLRLHWERTLDCHVFTKSVDFDELNRTQSPLDGLDKKLVGGVTAMTDTAWKLFIGVRLLESLLSDPACDLNSDPQVIALLDRLRDAGLASMDFPQVLRRVRDQKTVLRIPSFGRWESNSSATSDVAVGQVADAVLELVVGSVTPNRHLLAIDGLDKTISDNHSYWQTLAALIRVSDGIVRSLRKQSQIHLLLMCRSDVFRKVRFADAAKIAADGGIYLDWAAEAANPDSVGLWEYIARKASLDLDELFALLPPKGRFSSGQSFDTKRYLLQFIRYTPRDMSLLFSALRDQGGEGMLTEEQVRNGVDQFSSRHLLTEIVSEATGLLSDGVVGGLDTVIGNLPSRVFGKDDLETAIESASLDKDVTVAQLGDYLFLQGALGNYQKSARYAQFFHRRDSYKFNRNGPWVLHTGLVYAFNIPWNREGVVTKPKRASTGSGTKNASAKDGAKPKFDPKKAASKPKSAPARSRSEPTVAPDRTVSRSATQGSLPPPSRGEAQNRKPRNRRRTRRQRPSTDGPTSSPSGENPAE